jgi:hypothetical protein
MDDHGDGIYSFYVHPEVVNDTGLCEVTVKVLYQGGIVYHIYDGFYYYDYRQPVKVGVHSKMELNWCMETIEEFKDDDVTVIWRGFLKPPTTDTYTFQIWHDDSIVVEIDTEVIFSVFEQIGNDTFTYDLEK